MNAPTHRDPLEAALRRRPRARRVGELTVRGRVTLASVLVLALGLGLLTVGINLLLRSQLDDSASAALRERADTEQAALGRRGGRLVMAGSADGESLDERAWVYDHGRAVRRARASGDVQRAADELSRATHATERDVGERVRLRAEPANGVTVVVGMSLKPYEDTERFALLATLLLAACVLLLGAVLARRAVGKALQPVADMTTKAADWSEHDLEQRFALGPPRDEITALAATLDGMLARIGSSLRHEQRFSAEMAHELRTPLSGVRAEAELALADPGLSPGARDALGGILRGTDRMDAVIATLLGVARGEAALAPGAADAGEAAGAAVDGVRSAAEHAGVTVQLSTPREDLRAGADGDLVTQALGPLLDNAVRHARSAVQVSIASTNGTIAFVVQDDGEGIGDGDEARLFEPGLSTAGGAGLGLALARRLARACGGDVVAVPNGDGGRFELRLPAVR